MPRKRVSNTPSQRAAAERNWLLFRLQGARSIFLPKAMNILEGEEIKIARDIETQIQGLIQLLRERNKTK